MFHSLTRFLLLSATLWCVSFARYIPCETDRHVKHFAEPVLELPWGKYTGKPTDSSGNVTVFKNVRFGKAPVGNLRFKKSEFPDASTRDVEVQDTSSPGPICIQAGTKDPKTGKIPAPRPEETEDCLFLDIYVPSAAFKPDEPPYNVVVYLYGGAFFFGYKDTTIDLGSQKLNIYDGKSMLDTSKNEFIWVVGNYRVGAYGWLAGESMEKDGTPNAGLHDQKLLVEFVRDHISKVNGEPSSIAVWGNSAGASSIMNHLAAGENGDKGPEFRRAALWSPATQWFWDRKGGLENTFKSLATKAGCDKPTVSCLRSADASKLRQANQDVVTESLDQGIFPFGPSLDGSYVTQMPTLALSGYRYQRLESVTVSHVLDEAGLFLPQLSWVDSEENFQKFLNVTFPGPAAKDIREAITEVYEVPGDSDKKLAQLLRAKRVVRDSTILCNSAKMIDAQYTRAFAMQFNFPPGLHGSDLLPLVWNENVDTGKLIDEMLGGVVNETTRRAIQSSLADFSKRYQRYFAGYAAYGTPNALIADEDPLWSPSQKILGVNTKVLNVGLDISLKPSFTSQPDLELLAAGCDFWTNVAAFIGDGLNPSLASSIEKPKNALKVQPAPYSESSYSFSPWEL